MIIMLCFKSGIIFGLIGITILAKMMSIFNDLERMSFKKETHNVEDNNTPHWTLALKLLMLPLTPPGLQQEVNPFALTRTKDND